MTKKVATVALEASVTEIVQLLLQNKISALPVIDDDHRVVGIVSEMDLRSDRRDYLREIVLDVSCGSSRSPFFRRTDEPTRRRRRLGRDRADSQPSDTILQRTE